MGQYPNIKARDYQVHGDFVIVDRDIDADETPEGLKIPDSSKRTHFSGVVVSVGEDSPFLVGDHVKWPPTAQQYPVEYHDKDQLNILAVSTKAIYAYHRSTA